MPNNTSNRVHLKYLPLLEDFFRTGSYSWGSAVFAALYYELCRATKHERVMPVEWYNGDRFMRQFGCRQFVPVEPQQFADVHSGSSLYHPDIGGSSSYHPDIGGSSSYYSDIGGSSPFHLEQPPTSFDMFGNKMYSTPHQATIDPAANPPDVYNTPQRPPRQRMFVNRYIPNNDTTLGSFQF
ncbi:hypothetical protein J1N35_010869 [Gossypium stocksii]|uniref:Aminotransferase-like plant mobile domain-containing protein n=1 Tax=Gossypium stocksii TaxID=47602 RepID=A0A9D4AD53_9ROSI|nr:hypothetical protein J1N35_010869 [Gossypium stocksii]